MKNKCGPGQPPEPHRFVDLSKLPSRRLGQRDDYSGPTALTTMNERRIYRYRCGTMIQRTRLCNLCGGQRPNPIQRAGSGGGRMPGQSATLARSDFPRQFTLENYRSATARRNDRLASLARSYVFGEPTVRQPVPSRNRKMFCSCAETVDERSSLWKAEEKTESYSTLNCSERKSSGV